MTKTENQKKTPAFYEIAAKIVQFCDEMDIEFTRQKTDGSGNDVYDKRGLEVQNNKR